MDAIPKTSTLAGKTFLLVFILIVVAVLLMGARLTSSIARVQEERVFENAIPKDVPIKIKIKKEKEESFKDLKNENWAREFELELTNTGERPIYYVDILMVTDVKAADGHRIVFPLQYGRAGLGDIVSKPWPDDVPINPGETHIFKIHPGQVPAWEQGQRRENRPQPKKMRFELQLLSFGDGTGYFGNQPYTPPHPQQSGQDHRTEPLKNSGSQTPEWPATRRKTQATSLISDGPASFLPAHFVSSESSKSHLRLSHGLACRRLPI